MKRKSLMFLVIFALIITGIAIIISLNLDVISSFIKKYIGVYGYPAVFVFSFLSDTVDQPIGPEVPASLATFFGLDPLFVFVIAVSGSWIISLINFYIGKKYLSKKILESCRIDTHNRVCGLFKKYGKAEILIAALTPVPFVSSVWANGAFEMKLRDFFVFGMLPRALRIGFLVNIVAYVF